VLRSPETLASPVVTFCSLVYNRTGRGEERNGAVRCVDGGGGGGGGGCWRFFARRERGEDQGAFAPLPLFACPYPARMKIDAAIDDPLLKDTPTPSPLRVRCNIIEVNKMGNLKAGSLLVLAGCDCDYGECPFRVPSMTMHEKCKEARSEKSVNKWPESKLDRSCRFFILFYFIFSSISPCAWCVWFVWGGVGVGGGGGGEPPWQYRVQEVWYVQHIVGARRNGFRWPHDTPTVLYYM